MKGNIKRSVLFLLVLVLTGTSAYLLPAQENEKTDDSRLILLAENSFLSGLEKEELQKGSGRDDFLKSAAIYQTLIEERGAANGGIYYNQGNAYLSGGETGRAVLAYRRALRFDPLNRELRDNLRQAEEMIVNRPRTETSVEIKRILFFFHYDIPGKVKSLSVLILSAAFWILLGAGLFKPGFRKFALIPLIPGMILGLSLLAEIGQEKVRPEIVLTSGETIARKGDSEAYVPAFDAPLGGGTTGRRIKEEGDWILVRLKTGEECWIPSSSAEPVDPGRRKES